MGIVGKALHFSLGSLRLFADISPLGTVATVSNAVLDVCDAEKTAAVKAAVDELNTVHEAQLLELGRKHQRQLERLKETALHKIKEEQGNTQYVLKQYKRDVTKLLRKIEELKRSQQ